MIVLNFWLDIIRTKTLNSDTYLAVKQEQTNDFNSEIDILLSGGKALLNSHLVAVSSLIEGKIDEVVDNYAAQGLLVEALVLVKAFGNKNEFESVLRSGLEIYKRTNDRQAQAKKLEAALQQIWFISSLIK